MKKLFTLLLLTIMIFSTMSCAYSSRIEIDGVMTKVPYYGIASTESEKMEGVLYEPSFWNVTIAILGSELFLIPTVNVVGWNLMRPVKQIPSEGTTE